MLARSRILEPHLWRAPSHSLFGRAIESLPVNRARAPRSDAENRLRLRIAAPPRGRLSLTAVPRAVCVDCPWDRPPRKKQWEHAVLTLTIGPGGSPGGQGWPTARVCVKRASARQSIRSESPGGQEARAWEVCVSGRHA